MGMTNCTFVAVSHTDWDREWYQPFRVILSGTHASAQDAASSRRDLAEGGV